MSGIKIGIGFGQWKYGLPEPELLCNYAEAAEAVGLDSIWLSDHIVTRNPTLDITCMFAMIAARTKRVKMGPSVLTLPARNPVHVAKTYASLDYISGGRMVMAVGSGSRPARLGGVGRAGSRGARQAARRGYRDPAQAMDRIARDASRASSISFDDVTIEPKPRKGSLDIWIGGKSDAILKRVARLGDGWFPGAHQSGGIQARYGQADHLRRGVRTQDESA